ncbi:GNAT family N-acetyltransferase [Jiangella alkaliphila]|uniref:Acetyltransferase (GNAT) family protein n=1 Tax=Jiangella alkaliphila TaxID=419479 RepID=A0A1H2L3I3_9ACTN|nr:GNAT family N-acetyltransferase [Jiangella alkaliphila]SDU75352.1 Acetyltransferase (GNAT) family protein [Jiangella alkaliphila]
MTSTLRVEIAPATVEETGALTTMVRTSAAYTGEYRVMVANQTIDAAYIAQHLTRVAHGPDGELLGFVTLQVPGRGGPGEGEVDFMFVADDAQGRGIGRLLIEDLVEQAAALGLHRLHAVSHPPSAGFYRGCGFRDVAVIEPYGRIGWSRPHLVLTLG